MQNQQTQLSRMPQMISLNELMPMSRCLPPALAAADARVHYRFVEFFTAQIRNSGTRGVYARAVRQFFASRQLQGKSLEQINSLDVASYIEWLQGGSSVSTVKLHLAAIRSLFDYLVSGGMLAVNPAAAVRGPLHVVSKGKTPVLLPEEARQLLDAIDVSTISGLRDRALISVMIFSFARVTAAVNMNVEDYYPQGRRMWFRLREKGGKCHDVPVHHQAEEYLDEYIQHANIGADPKLPLFRTISNTRQLTDRRLHRTDVLRMVKRRAHNAALPASICCHTFRATGITSYLLGGGLCLSMLSGSRVIAACARRSCTIGPRIPSVSTKLKRFRFEADHSSCAPVYVSRHFAWPL